MPSNNILISVIIPAYNAEKYIEETIHSVLNQTYSNLEVIVADDGSTDNTANIVHNICNKDSRLKLIKQKNKGVSIARNTGIDASVGDYIALSDADDVWLPIHLELLLQKLLSDNTLGFVHSDYQVIDNNSQKKNEFSRGGKEGYLLNGLLLGHIEWIPGPSGILFKKEVIASVGGFDAALSNVADQEFFFRAASKYKIGRVPEITWYYRIHSSNMHSNIDLLEKDTLLAFKKVDQNKLFRSPSFRRQCYSNMYFMLAGSFWMQGNNKIKSLKYLIKSTAYHPPVLYKIIKKIFSI